MAIRLMWNRTRILSISGFTNLNVSSEKIIKQGFQFKFENIEIAFRQILEPFRSSAEVFESEQFVPHKKDKIFEFFSQAKNLESLTPKTVRFQIRKMKKCESQFSYVG